MILRLYGQKPGKAFIEIGARAGQKLSEAIWLSGKLPVLPLCAGQGECGRCRIRFLQSAPEASGKELQLFSYEQIAAGWRLACRQHGDDTDRIIAIELPVEDLHFGRNEYFRRGSDHGKTFLGIDLGTTSIQWRLEDSDGRELACGYGLNPQAASGADIIARIAYALSPAGAKQLQQLAVRHIANIIADLAGQGLAPERLCLAGNSAMTAIFLKKNVAALAHAPWRLEYSGAEILKLPEIPSEIIIPPLFSAFVGGDTAAGLLALADAPRPLLLADLGTNAEMALLTENNKLFLTSVPLGPALEGIGPQCGQMAGNNVICAFRAGPSGLEPLLPQGPVKAGIATGAARGISATGYISLLANLLRLGLMDINGSFCSSAAQMPLSRQIAKNFGRRAGMPVYNLNDGLFLTANDVEILLKVKAAFSTALLSLLARAGMSAADIATVRIAGALGEHARIDDLVTLGFLPQILASRAQTAGNTSLTGACLLARQVEKLEDLKNLSADAIILQLLEDNNFMAKYLSAMHWKWNV